jgi:hypothetical protein
MGMVPGVEHREQPTTKPKSGRQRMLETMAARWPQPHKTMAQRRAELTRMRYAPYQTAASQGLDENY